ncbi:hypothetical protein [Mesorhizobium sp. M0768]|uniref:hypothetical protein n=1 Tax=Mesorhizobium sp. M0768 TaxID=2956996 RepID=UPI003338DFC3
MEVLADLAAIEHGADRLADGGGVLERLARPADPLLNAGEVALGSLQQFAALAGALGRQVRVAAHHEALAGIVRALDLGQVAIIEQRQLQRPVLRRQGLDLGRPQSRRSSPVRPAADPPGCAHL